MVGVGFCHFSDLILSQLWSEFM